MPRSKVAVWGCGCGLVLGLGLGQAQKLRFGLGGLGGWGLGHELRGSLTCLYRKHSCRLLR